MVRGGEVTDGDWLGENSRRSPFPRNDDAVIRTVGKKEKKKKKKEMDGNRIIVRISRRCRIG